MKFEWFIREDNIAKHAKKLLVADILERELKKTTTASDINAIKYVIKILRKENR